MPRPEVIELNGSFATLRVGAGQNPCFFMPDAAIPGTRQVELRDGEASVQGSLYCGEDLAPFAEALAGRMPVVLGLLSDGPILGGGVVSGVDVIFGPKGRLNNDSGGTLGSPMAAWMESRMKDVPHLVAVFPPDGVQEDTPAAALLLRTQATTPRPPADAAILASISERNPELARCLESTQGAVTIAIRSAPGGKRIARAIVTTLPTKQTRCLERVAQSFVLPEPLPNVVFVPFTNLR